MASARFLIDMTALPTKLAGNRRAVRRNRALSCACVSFLGALARTFVQIADHRLKPNGFKSGEYAGWSKVEIALIFLVFLALFDL